MTDMVMPDLPQSIPPAPKKSNKTVIIIVAVVVVLCCLCAIVGGVIYFVTKDSGGLGSLFGGTTDITGDWTVYFSWDCTGSYSEGTLVFYDDDTFNVNSDSTLWGTWSVSGSSVDFMFDEYPNTHYIGTIDSTGDYMDGTMDNSDAMTGCWYASR
jgi:hypothetical protein